MLYLAAGVVLFISFLFLIKGLASADPSQVKKIYKYTLIALGIIFIFLFIRVGMPFIAAALGAIMAAAPNFRKIIQLLYTFKFIRDFLKKTQWASPLKKDNSTTKMTPAQAREILDVAESATKKQINDAYKRLMKKNHPDTGGSKYLAGQLNEAKDTLLKK